MRPFGSPEELCHRRQRAMRLLQQGYSPFEVARMLGVDRRSVRRWNAAYRSLVYGKEVWSQFRSWLRTMKTDQLPSELVVSYALRSSLFEFLVKAPPEHNLKKIITENMTVQQMEEYQMAA